MNFMGVFGNGGLLLKFSFIEKCGFKPLWFLGKMLVSAKATLPAMLFRQESETSGNISNYPTRIHQLGHCWGKKHPVGGSNDFAISIPYRKIVENWVCLEIWKITVAPKYGNVYGEMMVLKEKLGFWGHLFLDTLFTQYLALWLSFGSKWCLF